MRSFCHGVAIVPQPSPAMNSGGDCFACATTAALRHFFPEKNIQLKDVFERFWIAQEYRGEKSRHLGNTWGSYYTALHQMGDLTDHQLDIFSDIVQPDVNTERWAHDWGFSISGYDYAKRLDAWLRAGHLAFASIYYAGCPTGEWVETPDGPRRHATDHFVVLDGVRCGWRRHVDGHGSLTYQIHVVCSAAGGRAYWIDVDELLRRHGAGAWWLIRPDDIGDLPGDA